MLLCVYSFAIGIAMHTAVPPAVVGAYGSMLAAALCCAEMCCAVLGYGVCCVVLRRVSMRYDVVWCGVVGIGTGFVAGSHFSLLVTCGEQTIVTDKPQLWWCWHESLQHVQMWFWVVVLLICVVVGCC